MTPLVVAGLVLLMVMGVPLAVICGLTAMVCVAMFTRIPPQAIFQQIYQGSEHDLLQAVVFFIVAGAIMTRGTLASRLVKIGQALVGGLTGGLAITYDRGKSWRHVSNLPVSQFYHIRADMELPYNVYGGMQDNGSWTGPAYSWSGGGIINTYWEFLMGGDGFDVLPAPGDPGTCYAMSQQGNVRRVDLETGNTVDIKPAGDGETELRFHWNSAIAQDPFHKNTIYFGSQFVHKSSDRGNAWETISPDLTTNDTAKQKFNESGGLTYDVTGAENHTCNDRYMQRYGKTFFEFFCRSST